MTYNFDPDRWYQSHRAALEAQRDRGELDDREFAAKTNELERRYEEMLDRLDGTYEIPANHSEP